VIVALNMSGSSSDMEVVQKELPPASPEDAESSELGSKLTSECPPPPFYYKLFANANTDVYGNDILPPRIEDLDTSGLDEGTKGGTTSSAEEMRLLAIQKKLYGGTTSQVRKVYTYNGDKDYKLSLKQGVNKILQESLTLASDVPNKEAPEVLVLRLNEALQDIHTTLGEYRMHEARENLIAMREREIEGLEELSQKMENLAAQELT
jgi:hypothetical protein